MFFQKGERKIRVVADKRVRRPSSISFRVSANSAEKDIRIGLLGASGYTGAEVRFVHSQLLCFKSYFPL